MSIVCSISGQTPEDPVFSSTGYVFEKRLIIKALETNGGVCPVSNEPLGVESLTPIKLNKAVKPRAPTSQSVPGLLTALQSEWDSMMMEQFELRRHVELVRNQLAHSLYQHDAACRTIARLIRERDAARKDLADLQATLGGAGGLHRLAAQAAALDVVAPTDPSPEQPSPSGPLPAAVEEAIRQLEATLRPQRKSRTLPASLPDQPQGTAAVLSASSVAGSYPLHSNTRPGVTALSVYRSSAVEQGRELIVSGGVDGQVVLFDPQAQRQVAKGDAPHAKAVSALAVLQGGPMDGCVVSGSADKTVRMWRVSPANSETGSETALVPVRTTRAHRAAVTAVAAHPSGLLVASADSDGCVVVQLAETGNVAWAVAGSQLGSAVSCLTFHPDGLLLVAATQDGRLAFLDALSGEVKLAIDAHTTDTETANHHGTFVAVSPLGWLLASARGSEVALWDLRKGTAVARASLDEPSRQAGGWVGALAFDAEGHCLVSGGDALRVWQVAKKDLRLTAALGDHSDAVTAVALLAEDAQLATASMDRMVRVWAK